MTKTYCTYVLPHFDYCDVIYDGLITVSDELRLERTQNRAARLITGAKFRTPSDTLKSDIGLDTLKTRRKMHKLIFYRTLQDTQQVLPAYIGTILTNSRQADTGRTLRNAQTRTLPPNKTTSFMRTFIPSTTRTWNNLPDTIRSQPTHTTFKTALRNHMCTAKPPLYFSLGTKRGNKLHTQLRLGMSDLNAHQFKIKKTDNPS